MIKCSPTAAACVLHRVAPHRTTLHRTAPDRARKEASVQGDHRLLAQNLFSGRPSSFVVKDLIRRTVERTVAIADKLASASWAECIDKVPVLLLLFLELLLLQPSTTTSVDANGPT